MKNHYRKIAKIESRIIFMEWVNKLFLLSIIMGCLVAESILVFAWMSFNQYFGPGRFAWLVKIDYAVALVLFFAAAIFLYKRMQREQRRLVS